MTQSRSDSPSAPENAASGERDASDVTKEVDLLERASEREQGVLRMLRGPDPGALVAIPPTGSIIMGRSADVDLTLDVRGLSRRHARFFHLEGQWFVEDLGSRNGVLVEGVRLGALPRRLMHGDRVQAGESLVLVFELHDELSKKASETLYQRAVRDALTGLYNRRYLDDRLQQELAFVLRHGSPLSLLLVDLDRFKAVNDTYGHPAGDAVLRSVSRVIQRAIREEDVAARFGGEEIAVLARGTNKGGALALAERLRRNVESLPVRAGDAILRVTASFGVATFREPGEGDLIPMADEALYVAKDRGRNQCIHFDELHREP